MTEWMVNKLSRKLHLAKRLVALVLVMALSLTSLSMAEGAAAPTMADYQDIVSTYSINAEIVSYSDYLELHDEAARPDAEVVVEADTFTYYEGYVDGVLVTEPEVVADYAGETGNAVITAEESLRRTVTPFLSTTSS